MVLSEVSQIQISATSPNNNEDLEPEFPQRHPHKESNQVFLDVNRIKFNLPKTEELANQLKKTNTSRQTERLALSLGQIISRRNPEAFKSVALSWMAL